MILEKSRFSTVVPATILALSAGAVITKYGWLAAVNAVYPLFHAVLWASVIAVASWGAGELATRRLFEKGSHSLERVVLTLISGTGILVASAGVLAVAHLLHATLLLVTLAFWTCLGGLNLYRNPPLKSQNITLRCLPPAFILLGATAITLVAASTFAPFYDQWNYHLGFPYHWLRLGSIVTFPTHAYSFLPSNSGLLYLYALAGPGAWGAQVAHWWFGILAAGGSAAVAKRLGANAYGQMIAAALFAATPNVVQLGALAGGDLGLAAFGTAGVLAILKIRRSPGHQLQWMGAAGFFCGLALGCKYTAIGQIVIPLAGVGLILTAARTPRTGKLSRVALAAAAFGVAFAIAAGPWLARNTWATGNPVYPYFQAEAEEDSGGSETSSLMGGFETGPGKIFTAATFGTFARRGQGGDIGPVHLWLLPLVIYWVWLHRGSGRAVTVFAVFCISLALWGVGPHLGRYLIPTLAVLSALSGAAWEYFVERMPRAVRAGSAFLLYTLLIANCSPVRGEYLLAQLECALGARDEVEYRERHSTQLEAFRVANSELPVDAKVFLIGEPRSFGIDRDVVVEDGFRTPLLVKLANSSDSPEEISRHLREAGVSHLLWNRAEASRLAGARGREKYLECTNRQSQDRLDQFFEFHTLLLFEGGWWEIRQLVVGDS